MSSSSSKYYYGSTSGSSNTSYASREHREYGAESYTSTSTTKGRTIIHNHNQGIEDPDAPSPSSYGSHAYTSTTSSSKPRSSSRR
ncbi:hypothetical protein jhhlp_004748 [Lomentospora prolificans]|uniref:Uncharacterized protein n=1 Tax=Lomentospora prolificans TaxID=41688 RepID=A0A2N3N8E6_9PEZI|nr:hypothetical protein jhhlp_004748 [Lomentospora prolificans]